MKRINLLYTIPELCVGGVELRLLALAATLDPVRFRTTIATLRPGGVLEGRAKELGLEVVLVPRRSRFDLAPAHGIAKEVARRKVDIVHSFLFLDNFYGRLGGALGGAPVRIASLAGRDYAHGSRNHLVDRALQSRTTCFVANSRWMARWARRGGINRRPIRVIHNGIDVRRFASRWSKSVARAEIGVPADRFVVGTIGRLSPEKDQATFLRSAATLVRERPDAFFVIVGDGPERGALEGLANLLGLRGRVFFTGWLDRTGMALAAFDAFALTSLDEAFGNVLLEAMACGVPVVATRVGGVPEIVAHERTGLLVPPGNADAIAAGLLRLRADDALRRRLVRAGRRQVEQRFTLESMTRQYEDLYKELTAHR